MNVAMILTSKNQPVVCVRPEAKVSAVADTLAAERLGAVVATDEAGGLAGIISERDIVRGLNEHGAGLLDKPVGEMMTRSLVTCTPETDVEEVIALMTSHHIRHMPVVDGEALVGVVSILDVVRSRLAQVETDYGTLRTFMETRIE